MLGLETAALLERLQKHLHLLSFPYEVQQSAWGQQKKDELVQQLEDYIIPRVKRLNAPLLVVVGGSTGAGKSTLVNALMGKPVTRAGAIRPTTRQPILLHHPDDVEWFSTTRILPGLSRITGTVVQNSETLKASEAGVSPDASKIHSLVLVADEEVPKGLALLDAPDVDSVADENRALAKQLLAAADLWLFVTTANRYADAVPWEILQAAAQRNTAVAVILNRIQPEAVSEVSADLASHLVRRNLADAQLFIIEQCLLDEQGMLPSISVEPIKQWLIQLAGNTEAKTALTRRSLEGALAALIADVPALSNAAQNQVHKDEELRHIVIREYDNAIKNIIDATRDGMLLRGELLARWQDFVGAGEFFREIQHKISFFRDQVTSFFTGNPQPTSKVEVALESGLQTVMIAEADKAAQQVSQGWEHDQAGKKLLEGSDFSRAIPDFKQRAAQEIRSWQDGLLELVRTEGAGKRQKARLMSFGVNGVATALMIVVFASTAGLSGAEVVIAGGSAAVGQKLLESIFGEEAVRRLAHQARHDLSQRCITLMKQEAERFTQRLDENNVDPPSSDLLTSLTDEIASMINNGKPTGKILKSVQQVPNALEQSQGVAPVVPSKPLVPPPALPTSPLTDT